MTHQVRGELALSILKSLTESNVKWAALNGVDELPEVVSDIDVVVAEGQLLEAAALVQSVGRLFSFELVQAIRYDLGNCTALVLSDGVEHLQIDFEADDFGAGRLGAARRDVLAAEDDDRSCARAAYLLRKRAYKGVAGNLNHRRSLEDALDVLRSCRTQASSTAFKPIDICTAERALHSDKIDRNLRRLHRQVWARDFLHQPSLLLTRPYGTLVRALARLRWETGGTVQIHCADDAGLERSTSEIWDRYAGVFHRLHVVSPRRRWHLLGRVAVYLSCFLSMRRKTLVVVQQLREDARDSPYAGDGQSPPCSSSEVILPTPAALRMISLLK
jgi:hypothetical protein